MKTAQLYHPLDKHYPFIKNNTMSGDSIERAVKFQDQVDLTCQFWTSFFAEYGWSQLEQAINDINQYYYGPHSDVKDMASNRNSILIELGYKAGIALSQGHCTEDLFGKDSLPLYMNGSIESGMVLWIYGLTGEAARAFNLPFQPIDYKKDLPGLLYVLCSTQSKLVDGNIADAGREAFSETLNCLKKTLDDASLLHGSIDSFFAKVYSNQYGMRAEGRRDNDVNAWRDIVNAYANLLQQIDCNMRLNILEDHPFIANEIKQVIGKFERFERADYESADASYFAKMLTTSPGRYFQVFFVEALVKRIERMTASDYWNPVLFDDFMRTLVSSDFPLTKWVSATLSDPDKRQELQREFEISAMDKDDAIRHIVDEYIRYCNNDSPSSFGMSQETRRILIESSIRAQANNDLERACRGLFSDTEIDTVFAKLDLIVSDGYFASKVKKPGILRDNLSVQLGL